MRTIITMLLDHKEKVIKVPMFCIFAVILVYLLYRFFKDNSVMKYLPGYVLIILSVFTLIFGLVKFTSYIGIYSLEWFVICLTSGLVSLLYARLLDVKSNNK